MRLVVLSDTHIPHRAKTLPDEVWSYIENSDGVIHAGDFSSYDFYLELKAHLGEKNIYAVHGNMDDEDLFKELPEVLKFQAEGVKIGVYHGVGAPFGIEKRVLKKFSDDLPQLIIFGHSHIPTKKEIDGVLLFNPGSPTDKIFTRTNSFGLLEIKEGSFEINHIKLS